MSRLLFATNVVVIIVSLLEISRLYKKNVAQRRQYGVPQGFWLSIRNRGFWKDEDGWHNE